MDGLDENYALIIAGKNGDKKALSELVECYSETVHSVIYSIVGNKDYVEDLAQETFLKMIVALPAFEFRAPFKSWLVRVAVNLCRDHLRRKKVRRIMLPFLEQEFQDKSWQYADAEQNPARDVLRKERNHHLQQALKQLSGNLRNVFILRDIQDFSYEEIAHALNWRPGTVKSRLFRARAELAKILGPMWEKEP